MEPRYKRELNHNYLIIAMEEEDTNYQLKMLLNNQIEGLLDVWMKQVDGKREFYYEISNKQPLSRLLERKRLSSAEVKELVLSLAAVLKRVEEFLLPTKQLVLNADYIYVEPETFRFYYCCLPGYEDGGADAVAELVKYLLDRVDYQEAEAVSLIYRLCQETVKENFKMETLVRLLYKQNKAGRDKKGGGLEPPGEALDNTVYEADDKINYEAGYSKDGIMEYKTGGQGGCQYGCKTATESTEADDIPFGEDGVKGKGTSKARSVANNKGISNAEGQGTKAKVLYYICLVSSAVVALCALCWPIAAWKGNTASMLKTNWFFVLAAEAAIAAAFTLLIRCIVREWRQASHDWEELWAADEEGGEEPDDREDDAWPEEDSCVDGDDENWEDDGILQWIGETVVLSEAETQAALRRLIPLDEGQEEAVIGQFPYVIGKSSELADLVLPYTAVSRMHARIDKNPDGYRITDLNSTNGTRVGEQRLEANESAKLTVGEEVWIANVGFRFE